jgi:hypothetical protein
LERAEGTAGARFVEARARAAPETGATWIEAAGAYAMYDGPLSPVTQTFGLGIFQTPQAEDFERIEAFFRDRGAPVFHEVSPVADKALLVMLTERGYRPVELTTILFQTLPAAARSDGSIAVRIPDDSEREIWARTFAKGWGESAETSDLLNVMRVAGAREGAIDFLAEIDSQPVAAGGLCVHDGVAVLAGASTLPEFRARGAQKALLAARLAHAAELGCDLAMMGAEPGSVSQRNAERQGFRIAYTRIKWRLV